MICIRPNFNMADGKRKSKEMSEMNSPWRQQDDPLYSVFISYVNESAEYSYDSSTSPFLMNLISGLAERPVCSRQNLAL